MPRIVEPNRLRILREERKMSLADVAKICEVGTSIVSRWESGEREPSPENLKKLVRLYKLESLRELYIEP